MIYFVVKKMYDGLHAGINRDMIVRSAMQHYCDGMMYGTHLFAVLLARFVRQFSAELTVSVSLPHSESMTETNACMKESSSA